MGNPTNPEDSPWQGCPDCINELPETLSARVWTPLYGVWTGTLTRLEHMRNRWSGVMSGFVLGEPFEGSWDITFCIDPGHNSVQSHAGPGWLWHCMGGIKTDWNCKIPVTGTTNGGCDYYIGE